MEALIRKVLIIKSNPIILVVNLWVSAECPVPRYLLHSYYYQVPLINICPAVDLCYGKKHLPAYITDQYSKTDGVHPWGPIGVKFIGDILYSWWKRSEQIITSDTSLDTNGNYVTQAHNFNFNFSNTNSDIPTILPPPLYVNNPIGLCTRCEALADDADARLIPIEKPKGFRIVTRMKIGYGGFNPADKSKATKSFKRCWQADKPGAEISFRFYGSSVKIAIWQRRDSMGVINAYVDGDKVYYY